MNLSPVPDIVDNELGLSGGTFDRLTLTHQASLLEKLREERFTGKLCFLDSQNVESILYFYAGRITYATGGIHPVRRWYRYLNRHCNHLHPQLTQLLAGEATVPYSPSEGGDCLYQQLLHWWYDRQLSRDQLKVIIQTLAAEVLSDLVWAGTITYQIVPETIRTTPILSLNYNSVVASGWKQLQEWHNIKLPPRYLSYAPAIANQEALNQHSSPQTYESIVQYFDGKTPLRDLVAQLNQDIGQLTQIISIYIKLGYVKLVKVGDLPTPAFCPQRPAPKIERTPPEATIAFVGANNLSYQQGKKAAIAAGYSGMVLERGTEAITQFLHTPPALIFLRHDLTDMSGFDTCDKLRKIDKLKSVPILILGNDRNPLDQIRAKLVGASQLWHISPSGQEFKAIIAQYLQQSPMNFRDREKASLN